MRRSEYLKASPPMFESGLLDRFTRVHPAVPVLIYLPVIAALFLTGAGRLGYLTAVGLVHGGCRRGMPLRTQHSTSSPRRVSARGCTG